MLCLETAATGVATAAESAEISISLTVSAPEKAAAAHAMVEFASPLF